jgi:hypothetical protein
MFKFNESTQGNIFCISVTLSLNRVAVVLPCHGWAILVAARSHFVNDTNAIVTFLKRKLLVIFWSKKIIRQNLLSVYRNIYQQVCICYWWLVSTFVSPNVRPASTDFGIGCFSGGALVTSRSSRVISARVIVIGRARVIGRAIVPVSEWL